MTPTCRQWPRTPRATRAAEAWLEGSTYDLVGVSTANGIITVEIVGTGDLPPNSGFSDVFEPVLWSEPVIRIRPDHRRLTRPLV